MFAQTIHSLGRRATSTFALMAAIAVLGVAGGSAQAGEIKQSDLAAYQQAVVAKKSIIMHIHASWCPVCAKQDPILQQLMQEPEFKDVVVFKIDFDQNKDLVNMLEVKYQSTLIAAKGRVEVGRVAGISDKDQVREFIRKSL